MPVRLSVSNKKFKQMRHNLRLYIKRTNLSQFLSYNKVSSPNSCRINKNAQNNIYFKKTNQSINLENTDIMYLNKY